MGYSKFETAGLSLSGSAQALDSLSTPQIGVTIRAGASDVYYGTRSTVTAGTADSTDGQRIPAGKSEFVAFKAPTQGIYVIGTSGDKITYKVE